jgi:capsular polysaccharide export protein
VRAARPDDYIIYKLHPDVVSGNRAGSLSAECQASCVDQTVVEQTLMSLFPHIDELHTMTSLSGFEALIHKVTVHTWGQPFYAGWGLTQDHFPPKRRFIQRSLEDLVFITLTKYPLYIDWDNGLWIEVEQLIAKLALAEKKEISRLQWPQRQWLKFTYLMETLTYRFR